MGARIFSPHGQSSLLRTNQAGRLGKLGLGILAAGVFSEVWRFAMCILHAQLDEVA
jgi:hypothetical protein